LTWYNHAIIIAVGIIVLQSPPLWKQSYNLLFFLFV